MNRRRRMAVLAACSALIALALTACGSDESGSGADGSGTADPGSLPFTASVLNSNLGVGTNRLTVALINKADNTLVMDAEITGRLYPPSPDRIADSAFNAEPVAETTLIPRTLDVNAEHQGTAARLDAASSMRPIANDLPREHAPGRVAHEGDLTTIYAAIVDLSEPGFWGLEIDVKTGGDSYRGIRLNLPVQEDTMEPSIGDPAPASEQLTLADVEDVAGVSTAANPKEDMLDETIAAALDTGNPVVIAFATPLFCQTRFCGPVLETVIVPVWEDYGDRVEFVHVEPYDLEQARQGLLQPVPAVTEWNLMTEPIVFVVDREGKIAAKFEGILDQQELREALDAVLD